VTVALASLLSACGGGEDSASISTPARAQAQARAEARAEVKAENEAVREEVQQRKQAEAPSPEEQQGQQAVTDFYAILGQDEAGEDPNRVAIDSEGFCDLMSEEAKAQTIHYAKVSSGVTQDWDCEAAVEILVLRSKRSGGFDGVREAEVIAVNAEGDKATATVRFGEGPATALALIREDGEWKLAANPVTVAP